MHLAVQVYKSLPVHKRIRLALIAVIRTVRPSGLETFLYSSSFASKFKRADPIRRLCNLASIMHRPGPPYLSVHNYTRLQTLA